MANDHLRVSRRRRNKVSPIFPARSTLKCSCLPIRGVASVALGRRYPSVRLLLNQKVCTLEYRTRFCLVLFDGFCCRYGTVVVLYCPIYFCNAQNWSNRCADPRFSARFVTRFRHHRGNYRLSSCHANRFSFSPPEWWDGGGRGECKGSTDDPQSGHSLSLSAGNEWSSGKTSTVARATRRYGHHVYKRNSTEKL